MIDLFIYDTRSLICFTLFGCLHIDTFDRAGGGSHPCIGCAAPSAAGFDSERAAGVRRAAVVTRFVCRGSLASIGRRMMLAAEWEQSSGIG